MRLSAEAGDAKEPYKYVYKQQDDPFSFEIIRSGNQHSSEPIWNTTGTRLIYKEQYLEITSWAPRGSAMYGLGERISTGGEGPHKLALLTVYAPCWICTKQGSRHRSMTVSLTLV